MLWILSCSTIAIIKSGPLCRGSYWVRYLRFLLISWGLLAISFPSFSGKAGGLRFCFLSHGVTSLFLFAFWKILHCFQEGLKLKLAHTLFQWIQFICGMFQSSLFLWTSSTSGKNTGPLLWMLCTVVASGLFCLPLPGFNFCSVSELVRISGSGYLDSLSLATGVEPLP